MTPHTIQPQLVSPSLLLDDVDEPIYGDTGLTGGNWVVAWANWSYIFFNVFLFGKYLSLRNELSISKVSIIFAQFHAAFTVFSISINLRNFCDGESISSFNALCAGEEVVKLFLGSF